MNKFIYAEMYKNEFKVSVSGYLLCNSFRDVPFKIDTGCSYSTINFRRLFHYNELIVRDFKTNDILDGVEYKTSYGVETGGLKHEEPITIDEKMVCKAIKFRHTVCNLSIDGYDLPDLDFHINYDRYSNILIGMDILSLFDIHMGISLKTGKETLIAVLKSQQDKSDYNKALYEHFNLVEGTSTVAKGLRKIWRR